MSCKKCGNPVLPPRKELYCDISSQPCPICGEQNYNFGKQFKDPTDAYKGSYVPKTTCPKCGVVIHVTSKFCRSCAQEERHSKRRLHADLSSV